MRYEKIRNFAYKMRIAIDIICKLNPQDIRAL